MERRSLRVNEINQSIRLNSIAISQYLTLIRKKREELTETELLNDYMRLYMYQRVVKAKQIIYEVEIVQ